MITIEKFVFNPFQENTYVLYDETGECAIIDPGCFEKSEEEELAGFISDKKLKPVRLIYTHNHGDHMFGNNFVCETYGLKPEIHKEGLPFFLGAQEQGKMYGFSVDAPIEPERFIEDNEIVKFGNSELKALYTPGHVDGSLCFVNYPQKFVITGDVLFKDSIGRTDFPSGDFDLLMESIHTRLFTLPDDFTVYPGHGPETRIGYEKLNNPFIRF